MKHKTLACFGCAAMLATVAVTTALAQPTDRRTYFTFSGPVAIPGVTLPAGKYMFRVADTPGRNVVQVRSDDGRKTYAMFFALRAQRLEPPNDPEVRFLETAAGMPAAIKSWWYPGDVTGYEFVYPKKQARLLAQGTGQPVLTTQQETAAPETRSAELSRIAPTGEEAPAAEAAPAAPTGKALTGEIAPPTVAVAEGQEARAALPKTGSATPLVGLTGLVLLLGAALVRGWRVTRS